MIPKSIRKAIPKSCSKKEKPKDEKSSKKWSKKEVINEKQLEQKSKRWKDIKKERKKRDGARSGDVPKCAENTIRSKMEDKLTEEKLKIEKARQILTRPGRLRARSGSNLPAARFRSGPIGTVGCEGQGAWYFLRVLCWKCSKKFFQIFGNQKRAKESEKGP